MNYVFEIAKHNIVVRLLLFFARPFHVFFIILFCKMWNVMSYGPSTFPGYWGKHSASNVTIYLWESEFSPYVYYFLGVVVLDILFQEFVIPLMKNK